MYLLVTIDTAAILSIENMVLFDCPRLLEFLSGSGGTNSPTLWRRDHRSGETVSWHE